MLTKSFQEKLTLCIVYVKKIKIINAKISLFMKLYFVIFAKPMENVSFFAKPCKI
jgi:hypothetical protein